MIAAKTFGSICLASVFVLTGTLAVSGMQAPVESAERLTTKFCSDCHDVAVVTRERRTAREWHEMVEVMASRGGEATPAEVLSIGGFLARTRGIVAVNTAPASDFAAVLGLSVEAADAVVAYRTTHGKFADLEALLKVPGLDKASLERDSQALRFD